jgi:hypothetical protein
MIVNKKWSVTFVTALACAVLGGCGGGADVVGTTMGKMVAEGTAGRLGKALDLLTDTSPPLALANISGSDAGLNAALMLLLHNGELTTAFSQKHGGEDFAQFRESYFWKYADRDAHQQKVVAYIRGLPNVPASGVVSAETVFAALDVPFERLRGKEVSSSFSLHQSGLRRLDLTGATGSNAVMASLPAHDTLSGFGYREAGRDTAYVRKNQQWYRVDGAVTRVDQSHVDTLAADNGQGTGIAFVLYK